MDDHQRCRLSTGGGETELAGPPAALRALGELLRSSSTIVDVAIIGGSVVQEITSGRLLVGMRGGPTLHFSGGRDVLDIIWDALDGVADQAEDTGERGVNRHQHIEHYPGDEYQ
jgi:hypothetical protein